MPSYPSDELIVSFFKLEPHIISLSVMAITRAIIKVVYKHNANQNYSDTDVPQARLRTSVYNHVELAIHQPAT